jgi:hypothetical protein
MQQQTIAPPAVPRETRTANLTEQLAALNEPLAPTNAYDLSDSDRRRYHDERARSRRLRTIHVHRCLIVVPSCRMLPIPGGVVATKGINVVSLPLDEIESIRANLVADEDEQERQRTATAEYIREAAQAVRKRLRDVNPERWDNVNVSTIKQMIESDEQDPEFAAAQQYVAETCPFSPQSAYERMFGADGHRWKPISRLDVLEDEGLPMTSEIAEASTLASTIASTLAQHNASQLTPEAISAAVVQGIRESGLGKGGK